MTADDNRPVRVHDYVAKPAPIGLTALDMRIEDVDVGSAGFAATYGVEHKRVGPDVAFLIQIIAIRAAIAFAYDDLVIGRVEGEQLRHSVNTKRCAVGDVD